MTAGRSNLVDLTLIWCHETDLAIAVSEDDGETWIWLPKSMIEYERDEDKGEVTITLPDKLAVEKGLV